MRELGDSAPSSDENTLSGGGQTGCAPGHRQNRIGKLLAVGVASTFLLSVIAPIWSSKADFLPLPQEPAKTADRDQPKQVEIRRNATITRIRAAEPQAQGAALEIQGLVRPMDPPIAAGRKLTAVLGMELRLLSSTVALTPAQRREIALTGGKAIKQIVRDIEVAQQAGMQPDLMNRDTERSRLIHDAVANSARQILPADRFDSYLREMDHKVQARREVVILNLVARVDSLLTLSAEQREQLCEAIRSDGDYGIMPTVETVEAFGNSAPVIINTTIWPILTDQQRRIWDGIQKVNFGLPRNVRNNLTDPAVNEDDPDLKAALAEDPRP